MNILALLIFLLAVIIALAAIFNRDFQDKIFRNNGEVGYKKITIRGVSFLVLVLALVGGAIITQLYDNPQPNITNAIEILKQDNTETFSIDFINSSEMNVHVNNQLVGKSEQQKKVDLKKGKELEDYEMLIDNAVLGNFNLRINKETLYKRVIKYKKGAPYEFNDTEFWFQLEDLEKKYLENSDVDIAQYTFKFGEGPNKDNIIWSESKLLITKSDNGNLSNGIKLLAHEKWKNRYIISMGAGLYGGGEPIHIELLNAELAIIQIDH
jgi:hypothetical protein